MVFGTKHDTYRTPGITSDLSKQRQNRARLRSSPLTQTATWQRTVATRSSTSM